MGAEKIDGGSGGKSINILFFVFFSISFIYLFFVCYKILIFFSLDSDNDGDDVDDRDRHPGNHLTAI